MSDKKRTRIEPMQRDALPGATWLASVPVRFRHCDPAGIVFTPRYFDILQEAVERFFVEHAGVDYYGLHAGRRVGLGYAHASCEFLVPSRMGDVLDVAVLIGPIGRSSYEIVLPAFAKGSERVRGRLVTVTTSLADERPVAIPDEVRDALAAYRTVCGDALPDT